MSQLRVDEIRANDGTTTTEVEIPSLDQRFAAAWVNFNGTGAVSIRSSYNVSSITDRGTGSYTVNLTTGVESSDACAVTSYLSNQANDSTRPNSATEIYVDLYDVDDTTHNARIDSPTISVVVFR